MSKAELSDSRDISLELYIFDLSSEIIPRIGTIVNRLTPKAMETAEVG